MVVTYADPTTTQDINTQKVLSILPPIQEVSPPPPTILRPIDNHAKPHTLPPIQQQIQETAQPYRPTPMYDDQPSGGSIGSANALRARQLTTGQQNAQDEAMAQLAYALGYGLVGAYDALTNQYSDNSNLLFPRDSIEDASYEFGHNIVEFTQDSIERLTDTIQQIRDNPPQFEIPQLKIPTIEIPQIPEFQFPELPEFQLPEFQFPEPKDEDKPQPFPRIPRIPKIPKDLTRQLRELDLSHCGSISFGIAYATKATGEIFIEDGMYFKVIREPSSLDEMYGLHINAYGPGFVDKVAFFESGGGTGSIYFEDLGDNVSYRYYQQVGTYAIRSEGYPYYYAGGGVIEVTGLTNNSAINKILDKFSSGEFQPEVYKLDVSNSDAKDCPISKPPPPLEPPPLPPDPYCDCMAQCCPDIDYRKIQAIIQEELKKLDLVAAIPMSWQIRNEGNRPQLIVQCAEEDGVDKDGNKKYKSAKYPISVPHWDGSPGEKISLPSYIKGNWEGIYTLSDNSKVTINAQNEIECKRILNAIKPHISKQYLKDAYFKGGLIVRENPIKESRVKPRYGRYFEKGQKNNKPDWRVDFT
jgi:hypothetical protein